MAKRKRHIKQIRDVQKRYRKTMKRIDERTERTMTQVLIVIQNKAQYYTPQDTNALINSQYRQVRRTGSVVVGRIGYTQNYAAALHERTDWKPMQPSERSPAGGGYNPNAVPKFLERAAEEEQATIRKIIKHNYGDAL